MPPSSAAFGSEMCKVKQAFCCWRDKITLLLLGLCFTVGGLNHRVCYTCVCVCICLEFYRLQKSLVHVQVLHSFAHNASQKNKLRG